jgi:SMC interacting uncharacterized protein involved in chromosome segregation
MTLSDLILLVAVVAIIYLSWRDRKNGKALVVTMAKYMNESRENIKQQNEINKVNSKYLETATKNTEAIKTLMEGLHQKQHELTGKVFELNVKVEHHDREIGNLKKKIGGC